MSSPTVVCEDVTDRFGDDIHSDLRLALRQHERWEQTKDALVASGVPRERPVVTLAFGSTRRAILRGSIYLELNARGIVLSTDVDDFGYLFGQFTEPRPDVRPDFCRVVEEVM